MYISNIARLFILPFFLVFLLEANEKQNALTYLNKIRQKSGLMVLQPNKLLSNAAYAHARYLVRHQKNGHYEQKSRKGYTGRVPSDRVLRAGYVSKVVMENLSVNAQSYRHSIDTLFAAIYHRFVFLNFDNDQIGMGSFMSKKKRKVNSSFVYDLGSSAMLRLCKRSFIKQNSTFYMQNLCKKRNNDIPQKLVLEKQNSMRKHNNKIIYFPYPDAMEVLPAFYTEHPHPLPGSKVSGYPVSVQFNPVFFKKIKLRKFKLFDSKNREIKKKKILTFNNDKNHRFSKFQFALMPLKRLEYGMTYRVELEVIADGKRLEKEWRFTTKKLKEKLYRITKKQTEIHTKRDERIILYFEPRSSKDVLRHVQYTHGLKVKYLDQNTLKVILPKDLMRKKYHLKIKGREVIILKIFK